MKYQMYDGNKEIEHGWCFIYEYTSDGEEIETEVEYANATPKYDGILLTSDGIWFN